MILRVPIAQPYYSGPRTLRTCPHIEPTANRNAVNSRNAGSFGSLFFGRNTRSLPACALHFVGGLRRLGHALTTGSSLAAYRFSRLGDAYGAASLAVSFDRAGELA